MKVVIAPDSYKGCLSAPAVAAAIAVGVRRACRDAECDLVPIADGGEGTLDALIAATGGSVQRQKVTGPLGEPVEARWGFLGDGTTAVVELAEASGLARVPPGQCNPLYTTTFGTGELIRAALDAGARRIIVGLGGSATVDGGAGLLQALGARLLDATGREIERGGGALGHLERIDASALDPRLAHVTLIVACDVDNPLCGPLGAAAVYGPQKGATPSMVEILDAHLARLAAILHRDLGRDVASVPGSGAAGGAGAALLALGAVMRSGADIVVDAVGLKERIHGASLCFTGEGRTDGQTARGKAPVAVARVAAAAGVPVICLSGSLGPGYEAVYAAGIGSVYTIVPGPVTLDDAMARASDLIADAADRALRLFQLGRHRPTFGTADA